MSLLQQLRDDCIDPRVDIVTLLRKARVLASRLKNPEFERWIKYEMDGYPAGSDLPDYRVLHAYAKAHLIIGSYQMPTADVMASQMPEGFRSWAMTAPFPGPVSEISSLIVDGDNKKRHGLERSWPQEIAIKFGGSGYGDGRTRVQCIRAWQEISVSAVVGIIETVRNKLLEFVLQIEVEAPDAGEAEPGQAPITQDKVTRIFNTYVTGGVTHISSSGSKDVANTVQVGSMAGSQIQQAGANSSQTLSFSTGSKERAVLERFINEISEHIDELNLENSRRRKAEAQIRTMQAQLGDDEPDPGIIAQAGATLRSVTEGAIGSLIAAAAQPIIWHWVDHAMNTLFPK